jgi:hypothetical protein
MDNRIFLEKNITHFNGNKYVEGILSSGSKVTLLYEAPHLKEEEMMDIDSGIIYKRTEFKSFQNCQNHSNFLRTKNHHARNQFQYVTSGKNHKEDKSTLSHLVK